MHITAQVTSRGWRERNNIKAPEGPNGNLVKERENSSRSWFAWDKMAGNNQNILAIMTHTKCESLIGIKDNNKFLFLLYIFLYHPKETCFS